MLHALNIHDFHHATESMSVTSEQGKERARKVAITVLVQNITVSPDFFVSQCTHGRFTRGTGTFESRYILFF